MQKGKIVQKRRKYMNVCGKDDFVFVAFADALLHLTPVM